MNATLEVSPLIDARVIPEGEEQLEVLPRHFGKYMLHVEDLIFLLLRYLCSEYRAGGWNFYELSNGGLYMAPQDTDLTVRVIRKHFHEAVTTDAAGLIASLLAFRILATQTTDSTFRTHSERLLAFIAQHRERAHILAAVAA